MNIAIIGPGKLGSALDKLWTRKGHEVFVTLSRDPSKLTAAAETITGTAGAGR